jgi:CubicO group peptidase (beta-lactamase class C family)
MRARAVAWALLLVAAPVLAQAPNVPRDALRLLDIWFDAQRAYERMPAISAGVVVGQQLVWSRGYGLADPARAVPATPDTVYSVCSISKLFTSVALMQLWEAGKLSLDDDVSKHLPTFAIQRSDPDSAPITLRALMTHFSGLPREGDLPYWSSANFPSREQLYGNLREQRTFARVGERYQYSNIGMAVLGDVIAAVSGMPYEQYVQQRILAPLAMTDTQPRLPVELAGTRLAIGHGALDREGRRQPLPGFEPRALVAAMGYSSTVNDLARFAIWQLRLLERGGSELLKVSTLREMQRVQWQEADGSNEWGLGFAIARDGGAVIIGHDGLCPGYRTGMYLVPKDKLAFIGMANGVGNTGSAPYTRAMRRLVLKGLRIAPAKDPAALEPFTGRYGGAPFSSERVIVPWGEDLALLSLPDPDPSANLSVLQRGSGDTWYFLRDDGTRGSPVTFLRDAGGAITGYKVNGQISARAGPL